MSNGKVELNILKPTTYVLPELLNESDYENSMNGIVEPFLEMYKKTGRFGTDNELYYELYPLASDECRGTIVICHGFLESSAKYHELIYYFIQCGFQVAVYDLRGHGKSIHEGADPGIVHIDSFDQYVDDLYRFVNAVVVPTMKPVKSRMCLFAHSLGAEIGAAYIESYPADFSRCVLNSPMFGLNFGQISKPFALLIDGFMILIRQGNHRCVGQGAFDSRPNPALSPGRSEARYMYYHKLRLENREYQTSSCDYYWIREVEKTGIKTRFNYNVDKIRSDVLVVIAGQDNITDRSAQAAFISRLRYGKALLMPESRHDTYCEENPSLREYLSVVMSWFDPQGKSWNE